MRRAILTLAVVLALPGLAVMVAALVLVMPAGALLWRSYRKGVI